MTLVVGFFSGLVAVVQGLLITDGATTLSPLQVLMWAGLILGFIPFVVALIRSLTRQNG